MTSRKPNQGALLLFFTPLILYTLYMVTAVSFTVGDFIVVFILCTIPWIYSDACRLGSDQAAAWALGAVLLWIIVFPVYLIKRGGMQKTLEVAALKPCPFCGERVQPTAIKCRYCSSTIASPYKCFACGAIDNLASSPRFCTKCGHEGSMQPA